MTTKKILELSKNLLNKILSSIHYLHSRPHYYVCKYGDKIAPAFIFIMIAISFTGFSINRLTPQSKEISIPSLRPHNTISEQVLPDGTILTAEIVSKNEVSQDRLSDIETIVSKAIEEYRDVDSFPFMISWFLKFKADLIFKDAKIETSDGQSYSTVNPTLVCPKNQVVQRDGDTSVITNTFSPGYNANSIVSSQIDVGVYNFPNKLKELITNIDNCVGNVSNKLPNQYNIIEEYVINIKSQFVNYLVIFILTIIGLFGLLPIVREGIRFIKNGFRYFSN